MPEQCQRAVLSDVQNSVQSRPACAKASAQTSALGLGELRFSGMDVQALTEVRTFHGLVFPVVYNDKFYDNLLLPSTWVELGMAGNDFMMRYTTQGNKTS
jgi:hypothetical protein